MTGEPDLVPLLYRADWTRLSLTAEVRGRLDYEVLTRQDEAHHWFIRSVPPGLTEVRHFRARLVVAPGGRYRAQADSRRDEFDFPYRRHEAGPDGPVPAEPDDGDPEDTGVQTRLTGRYAEMLRPVSLLSGFSLARRGPETFAGRAVHHVVATPSPSATAITPGHKSLDRIEVFVDAETGILLRREEIFGGATLRLTEFTSARFGPLEDADARYFALEPVPDPAPEDPGSDADQEFSRAFSGVGWSAAKTAVDAASAVLGTAVRMTPGGAGAPGSGDASDPDAAIPADNPFPAEWAAADPSARPVSDRLLHALARGGSVPFAGVYHGWTNLAAMTGDFTAAASRHGWTGVTVAARALTERAGTTHTASRVRFGAGGRYRTDVLHSPGKGPTASACDGERRWRVYPSRVTVGPPGPDSDYVLGALADASWLLQYELSGETELTYRGRPAFAVRAAAGEYPVAAPVGIMLPDARAIVDAEAGIVLLFVSGPDGGPAIRAELRDVTVAADEDDAAFRIIPPPGVKVVPVSGNPLEELNVPDAVRTAAKTAGQAARAAERGLTAARGFFDALRDRR